MIKVSTTLTKLLRVVDIEALFWIGGLLYLALINPVSSGHLNFCLHQWLGTDWCPGCGLGRSISFLLHGNLQASLHAHPLGGIAFIIILARLVTLFENYYQHYNTLKNGQIPIKTS